MTQGPERRHVFRNAAHCGTLEIVICVSCRERRHAECRGGSWCDCQHLPPEHQGAGTTAEPQLSWVRQG